MIRRLQILIPCLFVTITQTTASEINETAGKQPPIPAGNYQLIWADEFDRDGKPDPANWTYERGFVRNEELQWYQPDNARCENGLLIIEARRERIPNPQYDPAGNWKRNRQYAEYSSACLTTNALHKWTYGRFEMRGRIDTRPGLWPAFWTLGTARGWPGCGEIDIMEYYRGILLANACWAGRARWSVVWDDARIPLARFNDPEWSSKFHIWRMDWDEHNIELYVDNELLNTIELNKTINGSEDKANPFHEPHYILLNLAIGGTNGGNPAETEFPARFEVDYVRVYQKIRK
ncbi:MAG: glycoside hydrolase family 16 protein [Candidatus Omnitrophota bacterium]|jgi:beta-glucanase (GH16 family)|nr:MAG: glycoside hydrolase family 16 protein [Candidatus Omnitrophota bacterium]